MSSSSSKSVETEDCQYEKPNLKGDRLNLFLLTYLYMLQGAVIGVTHAIPLILQKRNVTYADQAEYNIVMYSYAFKILWAPVVDSIHFKKLGRRKSWLVPMQYFIGILLMVISMNVDSLLGTEDGTRRPNIRLLTVTFFFCIFFASTQDVALDGWSLTMLQRKNVGYSAPCQSIGMSFGVFLASTGFIILDSKDFCNLFRSIPQEYGFVSISDYLFIWSMMFLVTTTLVLIFKNENSVVDDITMKGEPVLSIRKTYIHLWKVLKIRPMRRIGLFMFTCHVAFGPIRSVASLKLLDAGVRRDVFALFAVPALPFNIVLPLLLSRYFTGPRPLRVFLIFFILKLINGIVYALFIFFVFQSKIENYNTIPTWYYWPLIFTNNFNDNKTLVQGRNFLRNPELKTEVGFSTCYSLGIPGRFWCIIFTESLGRFLFYCMMGLLRLIMITALSAFFARISDPRFGGVYLTLLNSLNNVGGHWPNTICLWMVDYLTIKSCKVVLKDGTCYTIIDGFYVEVIVCTLIGLLWLIFWGKKQIYQLEKMDACACMVKERSAIIKDQLLIPDSNGNIQT